MCVNFYVLEEGLCHQEVLFKNSNKQSCPSVELSGTLHTFFSLFVSKSWLIKINYFQSER